MNCETGIYESAVKECIGDVCAQVKEHEEIEGGTFVMSRRMLHALICELSLKCGANLTNSQQMEIVRSSGVFQYGDFQFAIIPARGVFCAAVLNTSKKGS